MAIYEYDKRLDAISGTAFTELIDKGFSPKQISAAVEKLKKFASKSKQISYDYTCPLCGSNEMVQSGTCKTCRVCGHAGSCG